MATVNNHDEAINPRRGAQYYSVKKETSEPVQANIKGTIPLWINGNILRNGPGKYELGDQQFNHIFDGLSILHRFNICEGKVTYQNRFQQSDAYVLGREQNRVVLAEFGTVTYPDPCLNIFQRIMARFTPTAASDNYNINLCKIGDEFFACGEKTAIRKIDPETLDTLEKVRIAEVFSLNSATAHPHTDQEGTVYNMGSTYGKNTVYNILKIPPSEVKGDPFKNLSFVASIPRSLHRKFPSYYHSFGMTDNFFVFLEQSLVINVYKAFKCKLMNTPVMPALEFHPEMKAKFHLVRRDNGEILTMKFQADAFFSFHFINAYEDEGHVVAELVCYNNAEVLDKSYLKDLRNGLNSSTENAESRRYVLPLDTKGKKTGEQLNCLSYSTAKSALQDDGSIHCGYDLICAQGIELPQINYGSHNGKPYRYFYGINGKLMKFDTTKGSSVEWHEESCFPSEPYFIARPGATAEDDGVILSAVIDVREGRPPFLLILDARDFKEIGRAEVPAEIPLGFHGMFVPNN